jgi:hypothetical protein
VFASGAAFELIRIVIRFFDDFRVETRAFTPRLIAKPPPRAPMRAGSFRGFPVESMVQISKKLDMPAGQVASDTGKERGPT